jgi:small-conductance mechanosensitive channel
LRVSSSSPVAGQVRDMWQEFVNHVDSALTVVENAFSFAPPWIVSLIIVVGVTAAAWLLHGPILAIVLRLFHKRRSYLRSVLDETRNPTRLGLLLIAIAVALPTAPIGPELKAFIGRLLGLGVICLGGWVAITALRLAATLYLLRFRVDVADNLLARKHVTQVRVLMRILEVIIVLVTLGFALMTFNEVRQYGVTLFASAGVAGIVAGVAARPVMSNFLAGVQLAITQPIRIEDAVIVENEWGWIEEINFNYVVVRIWDWRRMVVPVSYFIEKPFQNWTRVSGELIGSVHLYVDYTVPVDAVRKKLNEIASHSKLWNGKVVNLQVTKCTETTVKLRALVSGNNSSETWDLRCEVREKLIDFLQREYPHALPRRRNDVTDVSGLPDHRVHQSAAAMDDHESQA